MEIVVLSLPPLLLALMVMEAAFVMLVGVPVNAPVDELMLRPDGSEPLVMLHEVAEPPVLVGVMVLMVLSFVKVKGEPL